MPSSTKKGDDLEDAIYAVLKGEINADRFWLKKSCAKIFRKKRYFSKDRGADIVVDVSIEATIPGLAAPSMFVFIECKNLSRPVSVEDVEEFHAKLQQISGDNVKGIVATTSSFRLGAHSYAKAHGIALIRYFAPNRFKWELPRSASASVQGFGEAGASEIEAGLFSEEFESRSYDFFMFSGRRLTNSLWTFFGDIVRDACGQLSTVRKIENESYVPVCGVPFLPQSALEASADQCRRAGASEGLPVDLTRICKLEAAKCGLNVAIRARRTVRERRMLGQIEFEPTRITVFSDSGLLGPRERFTLAHELGHHYQGHSRYLVREYTDNDDVNGTAALGLQPADVARMEWQANYFASALLIPRRALVNSLAESMRGMPLRRSSRTLLYLDEQPCNLEAYMRITSNLVRQFDVSRSAIRIRLVALGLLIDARKNVGPMAASFYLAALRDA